MAYTTTNVAYKDSIREIMANGEAMAFREEDERTN
jgi:hypothetical protein